MESKAMTNFKSELAALATIRDELKLKAHLARREVQDELERLEVTWGQVDEELKRATEHAKSDVQAIGQHARELLLDLKQGYESIRRRLT